MKYYRKFKAYKVLILFLLFFQLGSTYKVEAKDLSSTSPDNKSSKKFKICIDAGHGGIDSGVIGVKGVEEKNITLSIALKTGKILQKNGVDVVYTRNDDNIKWEKNEMQPRFSIAEKNKADFFLTLHCNYASSSNTATGVETFYKEGDKKALRMSQLIQKEITKDTSFKNRKAKSGSMIENNISSMPAAKVLIGFLSTPEDEKKLTDEGVSYKIANSIANAILAYRNEVVKQANFSGKPVICLDAGHGGYDTGAVGPSNVLEKNVTLAVTLKIGEILKKNGINVIYTRTSDEVSWPSVEVEDLQARCDIANSFNVDYFVAIHANSFNFGNPHGTETYYFSGNEKGMAMAKNIQNQIVNTLDTYNRGIKTANYYVLKNVDMPSILVELAFISNAGEEKILNNPEYQSKFAQAVAAGIMKSYGK